MRTLYLVFASEAEAQSILYANDEPLFRNLDVIGTMYEPAQDEESSPVALPGWHVNVLLSDDEDGSPLTAYETFPSTPARVWASLPPVVVIPRSLTRAQARAALIVSGLIESVQPAIDAIQDPVQKALAQNDWDHRLHFERGNPTLISLASGLGLSESQLDDLYTLGATL